MTELAHNIAAFRAARQWAAAHGHQQPDDRMLKAYGQVLLASLDTDPRHIIEFRIDGWTMQHPLACRLSGDLFACPVNRAVEQQVVDEPATGLGRYACWLHEDDGLLVLGDRVDQADGCPCLPGAPAHQHGAGGYCTAAETAAQKQHVIGFDAVGTWTIDHPDTTCWVDGACRVRQLAERQITSDLAQLMAGGRYACSIGEVGDVFQLDERLHDDQCTTPVCAACGCWCHAEEQSEG